MTFTILQAMNAVLAAGTLFIHFRHPTLWDDQAIVYTTLAGTFLACLTALFLGTAMLFSDSSRKGYFLHLALTLGFAAVQGYFLYLTGRDLGILHLIKSRMGG